MESILTEIEAADAIVLGSPVSFWNVTAIFRRFLERTLGAIYWPWGQNAPSPRSKRQPRKAVLVASSAMPGFLILLPLERPKLCALRPKVSAQTGGQPVDRPGRSGAASSTLRSCPESGATHGNEAGVSAANVALLADQAFGDSVQHSVEKLMDSEAE